MAAVYRTLYEKYEQNDVLHVGIQEVVEAEKEIDTFLKSLDRNQRDQLDTLLGRLSRAYEMQGFLFGGLASGAKWNGKTAPEPGDGYFWNACPRMYKPASMFCSGSITSVIPSSS